MPPADPSLEFCSVATRVAGQSIVGTAAASTSAWLVVEYCDPWEAKAFERAPFPPAVRERLDRWVASIPAVRPQLIRRPARSRDAALTLYLGVSEPGREQLRELSLPDHEAILELDAPAAVAAMRAGQDPGVGTVVDQPVVLVCTHGKRDRCCAKWGQPVYERLTEREDVVLWQTSHLGGHRFAATLLCLPQGICYGWVQPDEAESLVDAHGRDEVFRLDRLRGRTALSGPGQAAEHFVREYSGLMGLGDVAVETVDAGPDNGFVAVGRAGADRVRVEFVRVRLDATAPPSCSKAPEPVHRYEVRHVAAV